MNTLITMAEAAKHLNAAIKMQIFPSRKAISIIYD